MRGLLLAGSGPMYFEWSAGVRRGHVVQHVVVAVGAAVGCCLLLLAVVVSGLVLMLVLVLVPTPALLRDIRP